MFYNKIRGNIVSTSRSETKWKGNNIILNSENENRENKMEERSKNLWMERDGREENVSVYMFGGWI